MLFAKKISLKGLDIDGVRVTPPKAHATVSESTMQEVAALRQQLQLVQQSAKDEEIVRNLATRSAYVCVNCCSRHMKLHLSVLSVCTKCSA